MSANQAIFGFVIFLSVLLIAAIVELEHTKISEIRHKNDQIVEICRSSTDISVLQCVRDLGYMKTE